MVVMGGRRAWAATPTAVLAGLLAACGGGGAAGVGVGTPSRGTVVQTVDAPATVTARAQGSVTATAAGSVSQLLVRNGQQVRAGQVLMVLVSPAAQSQLAQAKSADAAAARMGAGSTSPGVASPVAPAATPSFDVAGVTASVAASQAAAGAALDQAAAAAAQLPAGAARTRAVAAVAQLRAQVAAAGAATTGALAQLGAGVSSVTGQLSSVGTQAGQIAAQLQTALGALAGAQRTQTAAAVATAQAAVAGLVVRAPVAGTVQLGTGSAPAGAGGGSGLSALLAQLPASVTSQLGGLAGAAAGGGAAAATSVPSDGASATIPVTAGSPVAEGGLLATVYDTSALTLTAEVDETDVLAVTAGVKADVEVDAVPGAHYEAHVTSVDTSAGASAQGGVSYTGHLSLGAGANADGTRAPSPRPGMSAVATLKVRTEVDAISLPVAAVVKDGDRDSVWVVQAGHAVRRDVTLGAQGDTTVAVDSGLGGTEQVVVRGADTVHAGQKV